MILPVLSLAGLAAAQNAPGIMMNPGGAIPAGIAKPNITGFQDSVVLPARGGYAICVSGTIPVTTSAMNLKLNYSIPANQSIVTETFLDFVSEGSTLPQQVMAGMQNVSGTYNISGTMCMPSNGTTHPGTIQFLTHGVGFDRYYWDFAPGYSYADYAALEGYTTFFYDRLGVGRSSKADPINEIQTPLELNIAAELIRKLRSGQLGGQTFNRVVSVGHSFGSIITQGLTNTYPQLVDSAVLTGFTANASALPVFLQAINLAIASQNAPYRFSSLNNGYLVSSSAISNQIAFFKSPNFDPQMLAMAETHKGTVTPGEIFSLMAILKPASNYTGAVAVVNGANDLPFCFGNCSVPLDKSNVARNALYPVARNVTNQIFLVPRTGHGINLHYSATTAYEFIQKFVMGLGY